MERHIPAANSFFLEAHYLACPSGQNFDPVRLTCSATYICASRRKRLTHVQTKVLHLIFSERKYSKSGFLDEASVHSVLRFGLLRCSAAGSVRHWHAVVSEEAAAPEKTEDILTAGLYFLNI